MNEEQIRDLPALLTPAQVAEMLGMHRRTVERFAASGRFPATKFTGRWLLPKARLLKLCGLELEGGGDE